MRSLLSPVTCQFVLAFTLVPPAGHVFGADDKSPIVAVEEHWELQVSEPAPELDSPQISFFVFPDGSDQSRYFELQLNYVSDSRFSGGGVCVLANVDGNYVDESIGYDLGHLRTFNDRITWTNIVAARDGDFLFAIKNGKSKQWESFGGREYLISMADAKNVGLKNYHPRTSLENVEIGFGENRVESIKLMAVTAYRADGTVEHVNVGLSP